MPWELDYALISFMQLSKAKYHIIPEDKIFIDVTLNLSGYLIDWENSLLPKTFFKEKFEQLQILLEGYTCRFFIYDGDELYGGLNSQKVATESHIDHYMILNPDTYFGEKAIYYLIESSKLITNKYFTITQEVPKLWDNSWDEISNKNFNETAYDKWHELALHECRYIIEQAGDAVTLEHAASFKWAGWMDLYSKNMWEDFWTYHDDWTGYGACDLYTMILANESKSKGIDIQQYILRNQLVHPYWANSKLKGLHEYYKNNIALREIPNQRQEFDKKMQNYLQIGLHNIINKNNAL